MSSAKIAISLDERALRRVDQLVRSGVFPNRSKAIQAAVEDKLRRLDRRLLAKECAKLDRVFERALAEEGLAADQSRWPEY